MIRFLATLAIVCASFAANAAGIYPLSNTQQFDSNGKLMPGARLFIFNGGTTTPRVTYKDLALTTPHPNPIVADASARLPLIFLDDGYYRQRLTTKTGTLIFDQDGIPVLTTSAGGSGTSVDPDSVFKTGDYKLAYTDQPVSGYVRANGRSIGSASSGATERANADTQPLYEHLWSFANITVTGGKGASAAADYAANKPLVLPDFSGRSPIGSDDLGAGARSILTSTFCTNPAIPGSACGAQSLTIAATMLPVSSPWLATATVTVTGTTNTAGAHNHGGATGAGAPNDHDHNQQVLGSLTTILNGAGAAATNIWQGIGVVQTGIQNQNMGHTHPISTDPGHAHTVSASGTPVVTMQSNGGGGQAANKLSPVLTVMILLRL